MFSSKENCYSCSFLSRYKGLVGETSCESLEMGLVVVAQIAILSSKPLYSCN